MMAHSFRGHEDVSSTPMKPHGNGPSSYHLPEMTQDTPRISFLEAHFFPPDVSPERNSTSQPRPKTHFHDLRSERYRAAVRELRSRSIYD